MVRIRMSRMGRKHRPFFRINAVDSRTPRNGRVLENLGWYDPVTQDDTKRYALKPERIEHWLSVGAQPSDTVKDIFAQHGIIDAEAWKAERHARVAGKIAAAAKAKAEEEAAAKAAAEAGAEETASEA